jgi:hypothetical protein
MLLLYQEAEGVEAEAQLVPLQVIQIAVLVVVVVQVEQLVLALILPLTEVLFL